MRPLGRVLELLAQVAAAFVPTPELTLNEADKASDFVGDKSFVSPRWHELFVSLETLDELFICLANLFVKASQVLVRTH
jgi:hypothetical protein